ncbi:hypothetical protein [Baekduia sp. Peel2402]|uniref:hypothetical protein n=1 Tax=Baekduia sp. Peel2402 TaxID=3458296 RepID=UPI00403E41D0
MSALTLGLTSALAVTAVPVAAASVATTPRAYEQVSPVDKHGADVLAGLRSSDDGDHVAFMSLGAYGDTNNNVVATYYSAHRSAGGWQTVTLGAPNASPGPGLLDAIFPNDVSDDLRVAFYTAGASTSLAAQDRNGAPDAFSTTGGVATWLTPSPTLPDTDPAPAFYAGRSADSRHVVLESTKQLLPSVPGGVNRVYELVDGKLRVASVLPAGTTNPTNPNAVFGDGRTANSYAYTYAPGDARAISADGSRIFFAVDGQLYVRIGGRTTDLVSASHIAGDPRGPVSGANAQFVAASTDGSRVFFTADKPLVDGAAHGGLYAYDLDNDVLQLLAELDPGNGDAFSGVMRSAADGSRIYFVTTATLGSADATAGQPNLFVAGVGAPHFIATLSTVDSNLWFYGEFANPVSISPDGRRLAFTSSSALTSDPNGGRGQVYEYAVGSTVTCVSCPAAGVSSTYTGGLRDMQGNQQLQPRAYANDGTLFFESAERLTADDTDDAFDVYAHETDGALHVISVGTKTDAHVVDNSADGRDVFIRTHDTLVRGDRDGGVADVYDARIGGGFPVIEPPAECAGEACRGPLAPDAPAPGAPASLTAVDGSAAASADDVAPTFSVSKVSAASRATFARTGKLSLSVRVSDSTVLAAKATATLRGAKKATTVASATAGRESAGSVKLALKLSSKARSSLKRSGRLTVTVVVSCSNTKKTARMTLVLRQTKKAA